MSYTEARGHFEKAKLDNRNKDMLDLFLSRAPSR
jgi:hypothetical protein